MSGIAGIFSFDGAPVEPGLIEMMTSAMAYRGPDGLNHWVSGSIALGHCMLRTTQESLEEKLPLANEDESLVLVMDGWLSNWEELRTELLAKGARLRSRADAELVLRAHETWGNGFLSHLDGNFALVIWDARKRSVFCVRDRAGIKPFHYHWDGRRLIIASDLHAILAVRSVPQEPNEGMIAEALSWEWRSRHETVWSGIMRLVGAHYMTVSADGPHIEQYWSPRLDAELGYKRDEDYIEHYRDLFADCVRRSSRSYGTVAYDVSGGHDSSAIFCVADYLGKAARLPAPAIKGYTLRHKAGSDADELGYARAVGQHLGLEIEEIEAFAPDLFWFQAQARKDRDLPGAPNGTAAVNVRKAMATDGSRVALCGEGGDEWLGANLLYYAEQILKRQWGGLYDSFTADVAAFGLSQASRWLLRYGFTPILPRQVKETLRGLLRRNEASNPHKGAFWLSTQMRAKLRSRQQAGDHSHSSIRNPLRRALFDTLNSAFRAHVMEKAERRASQTGIEIRAPFHDRRFIEFAFATPARLRQRGNTAKLIHLRALADLLPSRVAERQTKANAESLFRTNLDHMAEEFTQTIPFEHPKWLDPVGMSSLYHAYLQRSSGRPWIWQLWGTYECHCVFRGNQL
jgi:asparagine synthase (glutamine-hydrolysing)